MGLHRWASSAKHPPDLDIGIEPEEGRSGPLFRDHSTPTRTTVSSRTTSLMTVDDSFDIIIVERLNVAQRGSRPVTVSEHPSELSLEHACQNVVDI